MIRSKYLPRFHPFEELIAATEASWQVPAHPQHVHRVVCNPSSRAQTFQVVLVCSTTTSPPAVRIVALSRLNSSATGSCSRHCFLFADERIVKKVAADRRERRTKVSRIKKVFTKESCNSISITTKEHSRRIKCSHGGVSWCQTRRTYPQFLAKFRSGMLPIRREVAILRRDRCSVDCNFNEPRARH